MYLGLYPDATTTVTTHIIVTTNLLTLTNAELEATVEAEIADNPALELADLLRCPLCGMMIERLPCPHCLDAQLAGRIVSVDNGYQSRPGVSRRDNDFDPLQMVVEPRRLADHIMAQLRPQLEPHEIPVASYLAESLDDKGFLTLTTGQVAQALRVGPGLVERVLVRMQVVDPVGVASSGPQECLLCQLRSLPAGLVDEKVEQLLPAAELLLRDYWDAFLHARWNEVPIPSQELTAAISFIRSNLTPYPALADWEGEIVRRRGPASPTLYSRPDMAVYYDGEGRLAVEIFSIRSSWLRLSPSFREMIRQANGTGQDSWVEMADRARLFIKCLGQRQQTLRRAVEALVVYQAEAIRLGDAHIRPLTRTQLAEQLDVHEATVSRAINGKTAALPDGRIVPLAHFFESGKSIKEVIRQMVAEEERPLSDTAIAKKLAELGHPIARRTVAKYRTMLGILPVHLRVRQKEQYSA